MPMFAPYRAPNTTAAPPLDSSLTYSPTNLLAGINPAAAPGTVGAANIASAAPPAPTGPAAFNRPWQPTSATGGRVGSATLARPQVGPDQAATGISGIAKPGLGVQSTTGYAANPFQDAASLGANQQAMLAKQAAQSQALRNASAAGAAQPGYKPGAFAPSSNWTPFGGARVGVLPWASGLPGAGSSGMGPGAGGSAGMGAGGGGGGYSVAPGPTQQVQAGQMVNGAQLPFGGILHTGTGAQLPTGPVLLPGQSAANLVPQGADAPPVLPGK